MTHLNALQHTHVSKIHLRRWIILTLFMVTNYLPPPSAFCQELISNAGEHSIVSNYQLAWSLGEIVVPTEENGNNILTQGFHQTLVSTSGVSETTDNSGIVLFPNPTHHGITIRSEHDNNHSFAIYNALGKVIYTAHLTTGDTPINLSKLAPGFYYLRLNNLQNTTIKFEKL